jgi:RNA-directed DNA polymerase
MKQQVRFITRRSGGRSIEQVCERLGGYLRGWKEYFRLANTPRIFADLDEWIRHRLRAIHLKHWKRGKTIYRELRARGLPEAAAATVAANGPALVEELGEAHQRGLPHQLLRPARCPPAGRVTSTP